MDTSLGEQGYKRMSCNHTWCSLAVKTPQTWTIPIFKTSRIDSNPLTAIGELLQNPEWFALPQQSIQADLCTSKNTKNRKSLSARSNPACSQLDQCSGSRKHHFCVLCCWGGGFRVHSQRNVHPHFCELNLALTGDFKSVCTLFWWNGGQDVWFSRCGDDTLGSLLLHPVVSQWSLR